MKEPKTMSTQALEELLRTDFYAGDAGACDMGELLRAAEELARRGPDQGRCNVNRAWRTFVEEYHPFAPPARRRRISHIFRISAVCAAVIVLITTTAAAMGYDLWGMLAGWTEESLYLQPEQIAPIQAGDIAIPEEKREYADLQEALEAYGFSQRVLPRCIPEGYGLQFVEVEDQAFPYMLLFMSTYRKGEQYLSVMVDVHIDHGEDASQDTVHWQKDAADPAAYEAGGKIHVVTTNAGRPYAVWADGPLECCVYGDITMEELKQMIDSLYQP